MHFASKRLDILTATLIYLLYISVSVDVVVQKTTAATLSFCFSRSRRTVPERVNKR